MISPRVQDIHKKIITLSPREKLALLSKLLPEVSREINKQGKRDIFDLKGLGKEIWKGVDAQEYVDKERDAWV
ncbi:MAG: hypothetical protein ACOC23_01270 [Thermodesulfobacteriota bacterium]